MSSATGVRGCFQHRTFHILTEHDKKSRCCGESSDYIQKVKFGVVTNENCRNVTAATAGLSSGEVARSFGRVYPNYQIRADMFDVSCNKLGN
jgi:hypothetical protein